MAQLAPESTTTRALARELPTPANDDDPAGPDRAVLRAALRLFTGQGPRAAQRAHDAAGHAFFAADRSAYRWWLAVGRILDRTVAIQLEAACAASPGGAARGG